jgi:hypothetical protein
MKLLQWLTGFAIGMSIFKLMEAFAWYVAWACLDRKEKALKKKRDQLDEKIKELDDE